MYLRLNLATKPLLSHRPFLAGAAIAALVGGILFAILGWRYYTLRQADAELRARTDKVESEMARLDAQRAQLDRYFAQPETVGLQDQVKFTAAVMEGSSFNWTRLFMDLEHTLPPGVRVLRIEPRLDKGGAEIKFLIGAANEEAKLKLLKAFEDSRSFSGLKLTNERVATTSQPGADPLTVEFTALYSAI
jgi:Tfp pilus assembly protein PilN